MLSTTALRLAQHYSSVLIDSSIVVHPSTENSELHEAISVIPDDVMNYINDPDATPLIAEHLIQYDGILTPIVDTWEAALEKTISALTSTVFPEFSSFLESAHNEIHTTPIPDDCAAYMIEVVELPMWFINNPAWFTDNNRGTSPVFAAQPALLYDPLNDEKISGILAATTVKHDEHHWLSKVIHTSLKATAAVFDGKGSSAFLSALYSGEDVFTRVNDATLTILLTRIMEDSPPASLKIDPQVYRMYLRNVRLLAQSVITKTLPIINSYIKLNRLVVETNVDKKYIRVLGEVYYNHYLKNHGTPDALLGRLISKDTTVSGSQAVLDNVKKYTELWLGFVSSVAVSNSRYRITQIKRIMRKLVDGLRTNALEQAVREIPEGAPLPPHIKGSMFTIIDAFTIKDLNTLDLYVARLIGTGRYPYLHAEDFLSDMIVARCHNDNHTANTSMLVAVINHIAEYLTSKITVQPVSRRT